MEYFKKTRPKVICNPDYAMGRCGVLDQTTNGRYEIQSYNIGEKRKKCSENSIVIPVRDVFVGCFKEYVGDFVFV